MDEMFEDFIKSCLQLGKELLDKDELTENEEKFLKNLDTVVEKIYLN